jgi:hypothetical protein
MTESYRDTARPRRKKYYQLLMNSKTKKEKILSAISEVIGKKSRD